MRRNAGINKDAVSRTVNAKPESCSEEISPANSKGSSKVNNKANSPDNNLDNNRVSSKASSLANKAKAASNPETNMVEIVAVETTENTDPPECRTTVGCRTR